MSENPDCLQPKKTEAEIADGFTPEAKKAALAQLASIVAHEINNPLTGVLNNVQLIKMIASGKDNFSQEEFKELLDVIEESALRCTKITGALLEFSHSIKNNFQPVCVNTIIENVFTSLGKTLALKDIALEKDLACSIPDVSANMTLLGQVIVDIILNAAWAIKEKPPSGPGVITVKTSFSPEFKNVEIRISDTGIGISKENISKIFSPFFTTRRSGEGIGLGLAIANNIVKKHRGTIEIESEINKGTTLKILLPAIG